MRPAIATTVAAAAAAAAATAATAADADAAVDAATTAREGAARPGGGEDSEGRRSKATPTERHAETPQPLGALRS